MEHVWPPDDPNPVTRTGPAADPRKAISDESIVCLICGSRFRQLTNTHLRTHGITTVEYKRRFGYNAGRALMSWALRRLYVDRAVRSGLATRIRIRPIVSDPELRRRGGFHTMRLEASLTRSEVRRKRA